MLKSYLTIALRNLRRNRTFSIINMLGLAVAISVCLLIMEYIVSEKNANTFHKNYQQLYRVAVAHKTENFIDYYASPGYAPFVQQRISGIAAFVRIADGIGAGVIATTDSSGSSQQFREDKMLYADASFFSMFSFPFVDGNGNIDQPQTLALSEKMAKKLFNTTVITGRSIVVSNQFGNTTYQISGVFKDIPEGSDIKGEVVLSLNTLANAANRDGNDWADPSTLESGFTRIYLQTLPGTNGSKIAKEITNLLHANNPTSLTEEVILQPMSELHLAPSFDYPLQTYGSLGFVVAIGSVAVLLLLIGWINYINLSTALGLKRARETGIRKVLGANRLQLAAHYLTETLLLTFGCILLAIVIIQLIQPLFNRLSGKNVSIGLLFQDNSWILITTFILAGSIAAGSYVAFALSKYKPAEVFSGRKGTQTGGFSLRKGLVVAQFVISIVFIAGTLMVLKQLDYMKSSQSGMNMQQLLVIKGPTVSSDGQAQRNADFKNQLGMLPFVSKYAASNNVPGKGYNFTTEGITRQNQLKGDNKKSYAMFISDERFFDTYQLTILQGRSFTKEEAETGWNKAQKVLLNERAAKQLGFAINENIIGKKIVWGKEFEVIGLVKDYHHLSFHEQIAPMVFLPSVSFSYFTIQLSTDALQDKIATIRKLYTSSFPGNPFEYFFADESYDQQYQSDQNLSKIFIISSLIAIIIACLGLFGLAAFSAQQRNKEIGIRKVMGATVNQLVLLMTKDFLKLVLLALVVAIPIAWWIMYRWLENFAYRTAITAELFVLAGLIAIIIAFVTVATQALKAATINPVKSLRTE